MIVDTHTHLDGFARAGRLGDVLARASEASVHRMITIGTALDDWELYRELATQHPGQVDYSVGLHPCSVDEGWPTAIAAMPAFWSAGNRGAHPVAVGEIGLDRFHLPKHDSAAADRIFDWQRAAFAAGLAVAKQFGCPVVIHSRGAFAECVAMIDASGVDWQKVVFHCFSEGPADIRVLMERGAFGSFTGILTYKNAENVRAAALEQGLSRLMIETDSPFLTPMPHRGKPNEPAFLRHTAEFAAKLFKVSFAELARITTENADKFFL